MNASDATRHPSGGVMQPAKMDIEGRLEFSDETVIKCYKCYSEQVSAICHHCGRLLCKKCQVNPFGPLHTDNAFVRMRPLPNILKQSVHCEDCFHYGDTIARLIISFILMIATILILLPITELAQQQIVILTLPTVLAAVAPLASWGVGILISVFLAKRIWNLYLHLPFPVQYPLGIPVFPTYTIELEEHVKADFNITPDCYLPRHISCGGQLRVMLGLVPEDAERYRRAPKLEPRDGKVTLHAGFVALDQQKNVRFLRQMKRHLRDGLTFSITEEIAPHDFTKLCLDRQPVEWTKHYRINPEALRLGPKYDKEFPFFIKPRLLPGGRYFELMLELHKEIERKATLDHLILNIPPGCGVEDTDGQFDPSRWEIAWREKQLAANMPLFLHIEFQKRLGTQPRSFKGEYKLIIEDCTLSGLRVGEDPYVKGQPTETGRYMIRPASGKRVGAGRMQWMDPTVKHKTTIEGKVSFETSTFSAYAIHMEPSVPERSEEYPVSPNHKVIDTIIAALTEIREPYQVHIRQVIETLGRVTEAGTDSNRARCWEIKGRCYIPFTDPMDSTQPQDTPTGLCRPVDVHLVVLGEEPQDDLADSSHGTLCFELVLRSVVSDGDQGAPELQEHYKELRETIKEAIIENSGLLRSSLTDVEKGGSIRNGN